MIVLGRKLVKEWNIWKPKSFEGWHFLKGIGWAICIGIMCFSVLFLLHLLLPNPVTAWLLNNAWVTSVVVNFFFSIRYTEKKTMEDNLNNDWLARRKLRRN